MLQYLLMGVTGGLSAELSMPVSSVSKTGIGVCFANLQISSDGDVYENTSGTNDNYTSGTLGTWLDEGLAANVWVEYTSLSGTLNHDPTSARHQLSTDYEIGNIDNTVDTPNVTTFNLDFYDAASGGELLLSQAFTLSASRTS